MKAIERTRAAARTAPRGFTLIELIVAGLVAAIVIGSVSYTLTQVAKSRGATKKRLDAHVRAHAALDSIRRDIASTIRSADLMDCRVLINDDEAGASGGDMPRDELLLFANRLGTAGSDVRYQGEGSEFEVQYRVEDDDLGAALWQRRDAMPDRTPDGGGTATPLVDGVVGIDFEAYDGESWYPDWDSDIYGLPWAIRATVTAAGQANGEDPLSDMRNLVTLQTVVAIDRIVPPKQEPTEEDEAKDGVGGEELTPEQQAAIDGAMGGDGVPIDPRTGQPIDPGTGGGMGGGREGIGTGRGPGGMGPGGPGPGGIDGGAGRGGNGVVLPRGPREGGSGSSIRGQLSRGGRRASSGTGTSRGGG
jgi:type II secretion system protein J